MALVSRERVAASRYFGEEPFVGLDRTTSSAQYDELLVKPGRTLLAEIDTETRAARVCPTGRKQTEGLVLKGQLAGGDIALVRSHRIGLLIHHVRPAAGWVHGDMARVCVLGRCQVLHRADGAGRDVVRVHPHAVAHVVGRVEESVSSISAVAAGHQSRAVHARGAVVVRSGKGRVQRAARVHGDGHRGAARAVGRGEDSIGWLSRRRDEVGIAAVR